MKNECNDNIIEMANAHPCGIPYFRFMFTLPLRAPPTNHRPCQFHKTVLLLVHCNSMPLVRLGLTICVVKCSYFLVRHRVCKIMLLFCLGGSRQSLKVREVKCVPRDPATTCPVLFKGSRSLLLLA